MRPYIKADMNIDGRNIPYPVDTACEYLRLHDNVVDMDEFVDNRYELLQRLNQIIALKQSCFLLRHTAYSCESLADDLFSLKLELIRRTKEEFGYEFDDAWMEQFAKKQC